MPTMETFNFFKLWKTSPITENVIPPPEYDNEDAFFDLELNYENKHLNIPKLPITNTFESDEDDECYENSPKSFDSRSPISFLKSPPNFPLFFKFRKTKTAGDESPVLSRSNSKKGTKNVVSKYLRLMKKVSGDRVSGERVFSPERSPSMRIVSRRLGKSRTAVSAAGVWNSGEDSVLQSDGIQSAILYCKRSYNSSRDLSVLSRSVSEPVVSANPSRFSIEEKKRISI